ncbi:MAG: B3/4 domain-containing protein [Candidatus Wukongarchaeota archaeon]|nr:phenylalanine--tRNA ligase beta subunit-related protein [Candidatus Wukongarchaeota archaeon]
MILIDQELRAKFPGLNVLVGHINGVNVEKKKPELEEFKKELIKTVKEKYSLETLKDIPVLRAYRDFFWRVGIDPTKIRPAAEALIRRILRGNPIPKINSLVDAYNLASITSEISIAALDLDKVKGNLFMRLANEGENFLGIGMKSPLVLKGKEIVISDDEKLVAVYPYRDADNTKIIMGTKNILFLLCGVPGIDEKTLEKAGKITIDYVTRFCGGTGKLVV